MVCLNHPVKPQMVCLNHPFKPLMVWLNHPVKSQMVCLNHPFKPQIILQYFKTISYNFILIQIPIQGNVYAKNPGPFHKFGET